MTRKLCFYFIMLSLICSLAMAKPKKKEKKSDAKKTAAVQVIPVDAELAGKEISENIDYLQSNGINSVSMKHYNYYDEISFEEGKLLVMWTYNTFYADKSFLDNSLYTSYLPHQDVSNIVKYFWMNNGSHYEEPVSGKWFSVQGKAEAVSISTNTPQKVKTYDDLSFGITGEGRSVLVITFLGKNFALNFDVNVIPIKAGFGNGVSKTDDIIKEYGLPDSKKTYSFSWPDSGLWDGIWYNPEAGSPIFGEHWRYAKYPDIVFDIIPTNGYIRAVSTFRDSEFYLRVKKEN